MKTSTIIQEVSAEELEKLFKDLTLQIKEIRASIEPKLQEVYLTRNEVAELLKCDISTVHNWTKKGKLTSYGLGHRVYYKKHEVEKALVKL